MRESQLTFLEFFAGGGMARAGLGKSWRCLFANDFDAMKVAAYVRNYGDADIKLEDVAKLTLDDLPARPSDLAWASFPCQDLSLAGDCAGLGRERDAAQTRSGSFWPFWKLMRGLVQPDSVSSTARARSASPRSRDRARAISTVRCSSVAKSGDCPAMPCTSIRSRQRISPPTVGQAAGVCLAQIAFGSTALVAELVGLPSRGDCEIDGSR